jgi:rsbT co-antagonist protein RsbR
MATTITTVGVETTSAAALCELYGLSAEDRRRVRAYGEHMTPLLGEFVDRFYTWLEPQPEYEEFFPDEAENRRVRALMQAYWTEFFNAEVDDGYVGNRKTVGRTHAQIGLSLASYFAAMNFALRQFTEELRPDGADPQDHLNTVGAVARQIHLDTAVVVQAFSESINETLSAQGKALMEMSTPVTQLWSGILMLPVVGLIDSKRAQDIMNAMLKSIAQNQARNFILDISGVAVVDTAVANHLIKITKASALMGCACIISGISPSIAQTIVELGIEVGAVETTATMRDALASAFRKLGLTLVERG